MTMKATSVDLVCHIELWQLESMSNIVSPKGGCGKSKITSVGTINICKVPTSVFLKCSKHLQLRRNNLELKNSGFLKP